MIYFKYIQMIVRSFLQYRLSFWLTTMAQTFVSFFSFLGIYLLFERFGTLAGWTFGEVALCFAVTQMVFAITECFARGFDLFSGLIVSGDFDRVLLRPRGTVVQVLGSSFELTRLGRLVQSSVVLGLAVSWLETGWTVMKAVTLVFMILSGIFIFLGVFILGASFCFLTVQGLEVINIFTDGGREIAGYPLTIYNKWVARFFTFIIPFGCMNYLPLLNITDRAGAHPWLYMLSPLLGIAFLLPCLWVWRRGVGRYLSTGS